ncbi:heterokaryon incompatibility protein-domain-containing protein [Achaetomium macrosporum]|uniref:Heterokaryon incompatibility protein-domain-containing protein n=1 Tax=Achaetomium macrosporum TaxID=79813 RepID=A0AAN7C3M1_9PEZI|nr:heterokaryon incompatibility protein-domain-containing protein [Achaetomium macrosporum]
MPECSSTSQAPSEQTPLLNRDESARKYPSFRKIRRWAILALDALILVPFVPVKILRAGLANALLSPYYDGAGAITGCWFVVTFITIIPASLLGFFGPYVYVWIFCLVSYWTSLVLEFFYQSPKGRVIPRTIAAVVVVLGFWCFVDFRQQFTPAHLPPLSNEISSIRVLDIQPAGVRWQIKANLRTVSLEDNPIYEALTYEWGDSRRSHAIIVDGKRFKVTKNLWTALHNVRDTSETKTLWVDAICIDQTNPDEKSKQVPLMYLVYQRARGVLMSLGDHVPPRWVQQSDPSNRLDSWVIATADKYWETTQYWLMQLMLEEYWKRCWIVQEIGSALSIQIYAGRQPISWDSFIHLVQLYASKNPRSVVASRVLRFDTLRKALYHDGQTYILSHLLSTSQDSFCSVNLDKVLAFTGMAVDCGGACLPVNYTAGARPLYEVAILFQNSIKHRDPDAGVEMVHFAAHTRRMLSRRQSKVTREYPKPGLLYQPESWSYYWCGDDAVNFCLYAPEIMLLFPVMESLRAPFSAFKPTEIQTSVWLADEAEAKEAWVPDSQGNPPGIRILGAIVGEVQELGPTYTDYLRDPHVPQQWSARLSEKYPAQADQRRARGLNARLSALLGPAADFRLANVAPMPGQIQPGPQAAIESTQLFFGGDDIIMGLAPSNARVGDKLCQFWNSSAIAILRGRETDGGDPYEIVGRGAMLQIGEEVDWDVPINKTMFKPGTLGAVELRVDLDTLNHLSFDIVNLPGSL